MSPPGQRTLSLAFAAVVIGRFAAALGSATISEGFFAAGPQGPFRCRELMSSGRDDEVLMVLFAPLLLCAILRAVRSTQRPAAWEVAAYGLLLAVPVGLVAGLTDCGNLWGTLVQAREPYALAFAATTLLALAILTLSLRAEAQTS